MSFGQSDLKTEQLKNTRVKLAYQHTWEKQKLRLTTLKIDPSNFELYIRVFKNEQILQAWVKGRRNSVYQLFKTFPICASSGVLGPKRQQGDLQVPEGFYDIVYLQPTSSYHLALKVGYPNKSDRLKTKAKDPGGDIMIHGNCVTIGCIPLRDEPIEELYVLALESMNLHRKVQCDIFPFQFTNQKLTSVEKEYPKETIDLWKSLKKGYDIFELNHSLPKVTIDNHGNYILNNDY
jgi:murein L,D-transpeptidase YafK